ncbi:hypothetical protein HK098_001661 [Nowakowskiella sp. JEL0407]|nr:hypothetical protein HK098_001661 [Nowakowskiella sp. JEL0407]
MPFSDEGVITPDSHHLNAVSMDADEYFIQTPPPPNLSQVSKTVEEFITFQKLKNRRVALVTSGGTTVPLENQTVRFIDNFSAGTRGATSAEYFIECGYAVVFLHRQFSLEPYSRHYSHSKNCFLDFLEFQTTSDPDGSNTHANDDDSGQAIIVSQKYTKKMSTVLKKYKTAKLENLLLKIDFVTVREYLFLLKCCTEQLSVLKETVIYYLAAAVSDFFIPEKKMVEHKIQSNGGGLSLELDKVPKIISPLVKDWAKSGYIVSFKLETDESLLIPKSESALQRYGHQIVIGNMLSTRKRVVKFVYYNNVDHDGDHKGWEDGKSVVEEVRISEEEERRGVEIEIFIVQELVEKHSRWIEGVRAKRDSHAD